MKPSISRVLVALLMLLFVTSCRKPITVSLGQPVELRVGTAVRFQKSDLDLYFRRVVSDSRCPNGAKCVWAGEATVALEGRILKQLPETFEVRVSGGMAPDSIIWKPFDGYRIGLVKLEPYPATDAVADSTAYVGTFIVEKR